MGFAWLLPNHYPPWTAFHADALSGLGFCLLGISVLASSGPSRWSPLATVSLLASAIPLVQFASGRIYFAGDAWLATLYLTGFALAQVIGASIANRISSESAVSMLWLGVVLVAVASVGVALYQWLSLTGLNVYVIDLPPGGRPFANLAQPNQLGTLLLLGVIGSLGLYQQRLVNGASLFLITIFLCVGITMTQSRTTWLSVAGLMLWVIAMKFKAKLRVSRPAMLVGAGFFAAMGALWPLICQRLLLTGNRATSELLEGGSRPDHWASMFDALMREPWWGHGWNQISVAQSRIATTRPATGEMLEHTHNLVLDLLVWNGLPLGLLLVAALGWWFWFHIRACREATAAWLLAGIGAVFVHAMLEYPLDYAYFLLPVGLMMGAVDGLSPQARLFTFPRGATGAAASIAATLMAWVVFEYVQVEQIYRERRFEWARIGAFHVTNPLPDVVLLTQLREYLRFTGTEARHGMSTAHLDSMQKISERFGTPPVMLRYALAAGLNGQAQRARDTLARLCKMQSLARCDEGRNSWTALQQRYPELRSIEVPREP